MEGLPLESTTDIYVNWAHPSLFTCLEMVSQHLWLILGFVYVARPLPENGSLVTPLHSLLKTNIPFSVEKTKRVFTSLEFLSTHINDTDWW